MPRGNESVHSSPSKAEVKNEWPCTSLPPISLRGVDKDNFRFANICNLFTFNHKDRYSKSNTNFEYLVAMELYLHSVP